MKAVSRKWFSGSASKWGGNNDTHFPENQGSAVRAAVKVTLVAPAGLGSGPPAQDPGVSSRSAPQPLPCRRVRGPGYCCSSVSFLPGDILTCPFSPSWFFQEPQVSHTAPEVGAPGWLNLAPGLGGHSDRPRVCPQSCPSPSDRGGQTVHVLERRPVPHPGPASALGEPGGVHVGSAALLPA